MSTHGKGRVVNENEDELRGLIEDIVGDAAGEERTDARLSVWESLREAGLHRVGIDEDAGGSGGSFDDLFVITHALAVQGMRTPLIESAVADRVRADSGVLDDRWATLAVPDSAVAAWGVQADLVLVPEGDQVRVVVGEAAAAGVDVSRVPLGRVNPASSSASLPFPHDALAEWDTLVVATLAGAAEGIYRRTRAYVREREQFGRPLIAIPAVQNRLGDMKMRLVQISAAAIMLREAGGARAPRAAARVAVSDGASVLASQAHQLHGAMGITREFGLWPLTTTVWALRDQPVSAHEAGTRLGAAMTESEMWEELTSW